MKHQEVSDLEYELFTSFSLYLLFIHEQGGHLDIVKVLIDHGADIGAKTSNGY
jgi:ankyrin repeat protein